MKKLVLRLNMIVLASLMMLITGCPLEDNIEPIADFEFEKNVDWRSFRDLSEEQYAETFQLYRSRDFRLIDIEFYMKDGKQNYAMVWQKNTDGRKWAANRDMTNEQYANKWEEYKAINYRPIDIEAYMIDSELEYAGIWIENTERLGWSSQRNMTQKEFEEYYNEQELMGRQIIDFEAYLTPSGMQFAAIWVDNSSNKPWKHDYNLTRDAYNQKIDEMGASGYWVIDYEAYETGHPDPDQGINYAAIWEQIPINTAYQLRSNRTGLEFANLWRQYKDEGYRLVDIEGYESRTIGSDGSTNQYAGIWVENDERFRNLKKDEITKVIESYRTSHSLPGISVAVIQNGDIIYQGGSGYADVSLGKVANSGTVYKIASISKSIGGTLAAKLENEGRLSDGTTVSLDLRKRTVEYLPNLPNHHHNHQVDQILAHLSCIHHYSGIPDQDVHYETALDAVQSIWNFPLRDSCQTGVNENYSTHGYTFLDAVLEQVSGRTISSLILSEITNQYELSTLRPQFTTNQLSANYERSVAYDDGSLSSPIEYKNNSWKMTGGGLESNVIDLARFGWLVLDGQIVNPAARDSRMWNRMPNSTHGLGWFLTGQIAEHGGSSNGARSHLSIHRNEGLVIAVLSNRRTTGVSDTLYHNPRELVIDIKNLIPISK